jgi:hypothetical protein
MARNLTGFAASALGCAAIIILGVRSLHCADILTFPVGHYIFSAKSVAGSVSFQSLHISGAAIENFARYPEPVYQNYVRVEEDDGFWRREWFTSYRSTTVLSEFTPPETMRVVHVIVPHWLFGVPSTMLMFAFVRRMRREAKRRARGECWKCGYDLRATPERCPERGERTTA